MRGVVAGLALGALAHGAAADALHCAFPGHSIAFKIDRNQFAPPVDADDPPRRQVSKVDLNGTDLVATPILMQDGAVRGFFTQEGHMLIVQSDGQARYTAPGRAAVDGTCREAR